MDGESQLLERVLHAPKNRLRFLGGARFDDARTTDKTSALLILAAAAITSASLSMASNKLCAKKKYQLRCYPPSHC